MKTIVAFRLHELPAATGRRPALRCLTRALAGWSAQMTVAAAVMGDPGADLNALPTVPAGFEVKIVAREPLVRQPCALAFDARGRLFVGMGPQYRHPAPDTPGDSVVLLEDADADGVLDRAKVFATNLNCVQGLAWRGRDLWIANAPDLTIARDLDGDDVADEYVRVFTDLGNLEHGVHGLNWAPDGRLYLSKGNSKGLNLPDRYAPKPFRELWGLSAPPGALDFPPPQTFRAATYRHAYHDPRDDWGMMGGVLRCEDGGRNLEIVARGFRNPWDITFDSGFNWLGTDNDQNEGDRICMPFFGAHFGWGHAWSADWTGANHLPTAPVSGPVFPGSGTGVIFYDAPQFPEHFRRVFFLNDWLRKTMFVYRPRWDGALLQPAGGAWEPFVQGGPALFRPTDVEVGPDGALWCLGWSAGYGAELKDGLLNNEGRVFRIAWKAAPVPKWNEPKRAQPLARWSIGELLADLAGPLPVWRINALDELVRRGTAGRSALIAALNGGRLTEAQETWAAWALGRMTPEDRAGEKFFADVLGHRAGATAPSLNLRVQSLRILAQRVRAAGGTVPLPSVVATCLQDAEPRLRFEAVLAVRQARQAQFVEPLLSLAATETDRLTSYAAWQALGELADRATLQRLLHDPRGGVRRAALLALLDGGALDEDGVRPFLRDADGPTAAVAALWLSKHRANPLLTFTPGGQEFAAAALTVRITAGIKPADVRYTTDGTPPTLQSPKAGREITLRTTTTLKAGLFVQGQLVGRVAESTYRKVETNRPPVISLLKPLPEPTTMARVMPLLGQADAARGEQLFFNAGGAGCFNCHQVAGRGNNFGPELTAIGARAGARHLIESMLEPGAVVTEGFNTHLIETRDAEHSGILLEESGVTLTLGLATGQRVLIEKKSITRRATSKASAMPSFAEVLTPQQVADLTAWLLGQKQAVVPPAERCAAPGVPAEGPSFGQRTDRLVTLRGVERRPFRL